VHYFFLFLLVLLTAACASNQDPPVEPLESPIAEPTELEDSQENQALLLADPAETIWRPKDNQFQPQHTNKALTDYVEQLTMQLMATSKHSPRELRVGVASFVLFDQGLQRSTVLGNQLAELAIAHLQHFGVSVVDHKLQSSLTVSPKGDFVFARQADQDVLQYADYVLSGTMMYQSEGVQVNARLVNLYDKSVSASTILTIPAFIVDQVNTP
jgi:TolB-like protein